ncbi:hypothetical protein C4D60_Mb02t21020 [Musa balbisiana]|uniref:Uncharacterized protein n=1 Tax=Musa balbisiana TaxID=52838 RepID=A0A4S8IC96_MUSBA|nr:hypothetical protein C4D60_Mb02t21020 [Musa balbisiana]
MVVYEVKWRREEEWTDSWAGIEGRRWAIDVLFLSEFQEKDVLHILRFCGLTFHQNFFSGVY